MSTNHLTEYLHRETAAAEEARIRKAYSKRKDAARYSGLYSYFNPGNCFMVQECARRMLGLLRQHGYEDLGSKRLLDVGCGGGHWLREFVQWGARPENLAGIDLLEERIAEAKRLCPSEINIACGSAAKLEFLDETFDLVLQSTMFTSILDASLKQRIAGEMLRVLKRDGLILWYDYHVNNPRNSDVRGVKRREIGQLFPGCRIELKRITLLPPLTRLLAPYSHLVCDLLGKLPLLCTHYLGIIQKG